MMDSGLLNDYDRTIKRKKYNMMLNILSGYRSNVKKAIEQVEDGEQIFQGANRNYSGEWYGQAGEAFEGFTEELQRAINSSYTIRDELDEEIREKIQRLRRKIEDLS
ncbi:hypothetical protein J9303_21000 [Bacillaceae bacterium Marseille-Q3522]|nr:hypothetical protein [Bacillaceae bacterium Marseille-Q3522]